MKQNAEPNTQLQREGIALIVVLGFLSILILMAIAFLINMRTERLRRGDRERRCPCPAFDSQRLGRRHGRCE